MDTDAEAARRLEPMLPARLNDGGVRAKLILELLDEAALRVDEAAPA